MLYTPTGGGGGPESTRVLSVNEDCSQFAYIKFTVGAHPASHHLARLTGADRMNPAHWTHEDLGVTTTEAFYLALEYVAGVEVYGTGSAATSLWIAWKEADGRHLLEHWSRPAAASPWVKQRILTSTRFAARPLAVVQDMARYTSFTSFAMNAFTVMRPDAEIFDFYPTPQFPGTVQLRDRLEAVNGTALTAHTGVSGAGWLSMGTGTAQIDNGRLHMQNAGTLLVLAAPDLPAAVAITGRMRCLSAASYGYLVGRCDGTPQNFVQWGMHPSGPSGAGLYLYEFVGGTGTLLAITTPAWARGRRWI